MSSSVTLKGNPVDVAGNLPQIGSTAPNFTLVDAALQDVTLDTYGHVTGITSVVVPAPTPTLEIIAYARVNNATTNPLGTSFVSGFSSKARTSQGQYTFTFTNARSSVDYMVFCQCASGEISRTQTVNNQGTSSFNVDTRVISSGGTTDEDFNVIVYALPS